MSLSDNLILALFDKLLIGTLVLIFGYWLNHKLESLKGDLSFRTAIAPNRTAAYQALWEKTANFTPRETSPLDVSLARTDYLTNLRDWYYEAGNAMYLSLGSSDLLLRGFKLLERTDVSAQEIKDHFSRLRTQLKVDLGVYSPADASVQIPRAR